MINDILRLAIYYLEALLKRPWMAIAPAALTLALSVAVILSLPRSYQSEAQLLIEAPQSQASLLPATVATEHMQFVEQRVLARDNLLELAQKVGLFPGLRATMPDTKFAQLIRQNISIQTVASEPSDRYAGTISMRVGFTALDAERASATVAALVNMIIEENRGLRIQRASEVSEFLAREVSELTQKSAAREVEWRSFFEENADAMPARAQSLDTEHQERDRELAGLEQSITTLDQELRLLEAELRLGRQRPEASTRDRAQLSELESELATKSLTFSAAHPEIRALTQRIDGIKQKIKTETSQATGNGTLTPELALIAERVEIAKARHEALVNRRDELNQSIARLQTVRARLPSVQAQLQGIERERETMQRNLDEMRGRLAAARVGERLERDSATGHVQILEQPETPRYPASPSRTRLLLMSIVAACVAAGAGVYLGDSLRRTVRGTFDLKAPLAGSTLVVIPDWSPFDAPEALKETIVRRVTRMLGLNRPVAT